MLQRLLAWLRPRPAPRSQTIANDPILWPNARIRFPHKPDSLPAVDGFKFKAQMLDGRVMDGEVMMLGSWRTLRLVDPTLHPKNPRTVISAEPHSLQGWRHA